MSRVETAVSVKNPEELRKRLLSDRLFSAIERDDVADVKKCVELGVDLNCVGFGFLHGTPLMEAVGSDKPHALEIARYLVEHGANVNKKNRWSRSVLHYAVASGNPMKLEIVRFLMEHGRRHPNDSGGRANPNACTLAGESPLMWAVLTDSKHAHALAIVECLVEGGADIGLRAINGDTVVEYAEKHDKEIFDYLLSAREKLARDARDESPELAR